MMRSGKAFPSSLPLLEEARRQIEELDLRLAQSQPGSSVHGARRLIKQLRSHLRLLRTAVGEDAYATCNAALRDAADALAGHRRAEALIAAATKLESAAGDRRFWRNCAEAHGRAHAALQDPAVGLATARDAIGRARDCLGSAVAANPKGDPIARAFFETYRRARRRLRRAFRSGVAADLHEARKDVIHHIHHLRLLVPDAGRRAAALEELRIILGDLNDLDELEQLAPGHHALGEDERRLGKARKRLVAKARKRSASLFEDPARHFSRRFRHATKPRSPESALPLQAEE